MIHDEQHFEMLAALAVAGQVTEAELSELNQHAAHCLPCAQRLSEMEIASRQLFFVKALTTRDVNTPVGMQERFMARAIEAGVPLHRPSVAQTYPNAFRFAHIATVLILIAGLAWNAVSERHAATSSYFTGTLGASAPPPSFPSAPTAGRRQSSLLPLQRPDKKQRLRKLHLQKQVPLLADVSPGVGRPNEKRFFVLNSTFFPATTTRLGEFGGSNDGFHPFSPDYFVSDRRPRTLEFPNLSASNLWSAHDQNEPHKRVFHYSAALASLIFAERQSDFGGKRNVPELSTRDAFNPVRLR